MSATAKTASSTTPSALRPGATPVAGGPKPLLASEALASERAPLEPGQQACRHWLVFVALGLLLVGFATQRGIGPERMQGGAVAFSAAGTAFTLAILPFPYALRAGISLLLGMALMGLGLRGLGPLTGLALDGGEARDSVRLLTLTLLPAALMLRARYASFAPSRWVLGVALVLSMPFLVLELSLAMAPDVSAVTRSGAIGASAVLLASLFGFFGDGSLGSKSPVAWLILIVLPLELGLRELTPLAGGEMGALAYPLTAVSLLLASILTSTGAYQLAATVFGPMAREGLRRKLRAASDPADKRLNLTER